MSKTAPRESAGDKLLRALMDDPDDDAVYLVLADWHTECGDPRGNLIMLQHQRASQDSDAPLRDYITEHADQLLGPIRDLETNDCHLEGHWRYGFISRLAIGWKVPRDREPFLGQIRDADVMKETLEAALSHPTTQLLGELTLAPTTSTLAAAALAMPATWNLRRLEIQLHDWTEMSRVVEAIASYPRERLVSLALGHASYHDFMLAGEVEGTAHEDGPFVNTATLQKLTTATPALRELRLAGGRLFKGLDHPTLKSLELHGNPVDGLFHNYYPASICLPELERFVNIAEYDEYRETPIMPLSLEPGRLPSLREVTFVGDYDEGNSDTSLYALLAQSPILAQLARVSLPYLCGCYDGPVLEQLAQHYAHLEQLAVGSLRDGEDADGDFEARCRQALPPLKLGPK